MKWLFIVLSTMDFCLTAFLYDGDIHKIEANPLAHEALFNWGLIGLAGFKIFMVVFILTMCDFINLHSVRHAGRVEKFAVTVTGLVVLYTMIIIVGYYGNFLPDPNRM